MTTASRSTTKKSSEDPKSVRVWSEVGVTLAVTDDPPQFLRFTFGHERIAKNDSIAELKRVSNAMDEFNEEQLQKRITQYQRLVKAHGDEVGEVDDVPKKGSVKERARKRMG